MNLKHFDTKYFIRGIMTYRELLKNAMVAPELVDFTKLRILFSESSEYAPCIPDIELAKKLEEALKVGNITKAADFIEKILSNYYLDINAHVLADFVHDELNDTGKSYFHRVFAKGLLDSILDSGDGRNFDTAYRVIDIREEYVVLESLGIVPNKQEFMEWEGKQFDVFEEFSPETRLTKFIYFNIDIPKRWLDAYEIRKTIMN